MSSVAKERGRRAPSELRRTWQRLSRHPSIRKPGDQQFRELRTWTGVPGCMARAGVGNRRDKVASMSVSLGRRGHGLAARRAQAPTLVKRPDPRAHRLRGGVPICIDIASSQIERNLDEYPVEQRRTVPMHGRDTMRLPNREHESHAWRIRDIAPDFTLEDVWALPARGGPDDFGALLEVNSQSRAIPKPR